jgi:hypothetical protein
MASTDAVADRDLGKQLRDVIAAALAQVPAAHRQRTPVVVAAADACVHAATRYGLAWADTSRQLRPSDSVRLETSELLRTLGAEADWHGPLYLVVSATGDAEQAMLAAQALAAAGREVVVGRVRATGETFAVDATVVRAGR